MKNLDEIKNELKEIQVNFNPEKSTYKIIDSVINDSMSVDLMIKSLQGIKGINKYPDDIKNKYFEIIDSLDKILVLEKEKAYKEEQEKKTRELKDIISSLEKRDNKKNDDALSKDDNNSNSDEGKDNDKNVLSDDNKSDDDGSVRDLSLDKIVPRSVLSDKVKDEKVSDDRVVDKSKRIFSCLLGLIALCIMIGVLLIIFL